MTAYPLLHLLQTELLFDDNGKKSSLRDGASMLKCLCVCIGGGRGWSQQSSHPQRQPCKHAKIATITMSPTGEIKFRHQTPILLLPFRSSIELEL